MSQDPALVSLTPEARREAQEKAGKKRIAREIIKLRKRLGLGKNHPYSCDVHIDFFLPPLSNLFWFKLSFFIPVSRYFLTLLCPPCGRHISGPPSPVQHHGFRPPLDGALRQRAREGESQFPSHDSEETQGKPQN